MKLHPDVATEPDAGRALQEGRRGVRGAAGPEEARPLRPGRRPARRRHGRRLQRRLRAAGGFDFTNLVDAMFGQQGARGPAVPGPPRPGRPGPAGPRAGRGGVRHHQAAAGRHRRAVPALQRLRRGRGLPAGPLRDLPRPGRRHPRAAVVHRRHPDHPALPDLPRLRHGHPQPVPRSAPATAGSGPPGRSTSRSRPGSAPATGSTWPRTARSGPAVARPATCTSSCTWPATRSSAARATTSRSSSRSR